MVLYHIKERAYQYFYFTKEEIRDISIAVIITGFIFSFRDWGIGSQIDVFAGITHLIITILIAALTFFVHESSHRLIALGMGLRAEFKLWWGGLITALALAFASNGVIQLVLPGGVVNSFIVRQRMGEFRYGFNYWDNGIIAMFGPLANLLLAFITKILLYFLPGSWILEKLLLMNIIFAICGMLPIPPLDGINTFFGGRILYVIFLTLIVGTSLLLYYFPLIIAIVGGIIITIVATILYFTKIETNLT